ncbi:MAG TPA: HAD-IA family hydrolase [Chlamydiales bacterium]|nr:HAD-IA family hydrolase [Chlamydiales bacterium]
MLKTIFFDLGNVLVFFSHAKMLEQMADCTGLSQEDLRTILIDEKIHELYESGKMDSLTVYRLVQARSSKSFPMHALFDAASNIFTPNTALFPLIEQLKKEGIRLILLSNTSECHWNRVFTDYSILQLFDDLVLSFQVGALKPSKEIFFNALSRAHCDPKYCFYTDDVPEFVEGARNAGLDSEIFINGSRLKKALAIRGLHLLS